MAKFNTLREIYIAFMKMHSKDALAYGTERKTTVTFMDSFKQDLPDEYLLSVDEENLAESIREMYYRNESPKPSDLDITNGLAGAIRESVKKPAEPRFSRSVFENIRFLQRSGELYYSNISRITKDISTFVPSPQTRHAVEFLDGTIRDAVRIAMKKAKELTGILNEYQSSKTREHAVMTVWKHIEKHFDQAMSGASGRFNCAMDNDAGERLSLHFIRSTAIKAVRRYGRAILYTEEMDLNDTAHADVFPVRKEIFPCEFAYSARLGHNDTLALQIQLLTSMRCFGNEWGLAAGIPYSSKMLSGISMVASGDIDGEQVDSFFRKYFSELSSAVHTALDCITGFMVGGPFLDGDPRSERMIDKRIDLEQFAYKNVMKLLTMLDGKDLEYIYMDLAALRDRANPNPLRFYPGAIIYKLCRHEVQRAVYLMRRCGV